MDIVKYVWTSMIEEEEEWKGKPVSRLKGMVFFRMRVCGLYREKKRWGYAKRKKKVCEREQGARRREREVGLPVDTDLDGHDGWSVGSFGSC